ncbi:MAG TPA: hypothetical protein VM074_00540 [Solimonas sp.]|nr:hypothetical protein [Solimonas sp.]
MAEAWEQQRERGTPWAMRLLLWITRSLGRSAARLALFPVTAYFLLTGTAARRASREFLRRALQREPSLRDITRHFFSFTAVSLDRIYWLSGANQDLIVESLRKPEAEAMQDRGGCLTLVAHLGSFDVRRSTRNARRNMPMRIVLDREHGRMFMRLLEQLNPQLAASVIDASQRGPSMVLAIKQALDEGSMVGMMADRVRAGEKVVSVDFLGGKANLPMAPWIIAGVLGVPVVIAFGLYRGGNKYEAHLELLAERVELPRNGREAAIQHYAQKYADRLAHYARLAPFNWFNFYDFWADETVSA